jgi:hypothetical protein
MTMTELAESTNLGEMIGPMTVDSIDQRELAEQLLEQAKEQNIVKQHRFAASSAHGETGFEPGTPRFSGDPDAED